MLLASGSLRALQRAAGNAAVAQSVQRHCFPGHEQAPVTLGDFPGIKALVHLYRELEQLFAAGPGEHNRAYSLIIAWNRGQPRARRFDPDKHPRNVTGYVAPPRAAADVIAASFNAGVPMHLKETNVREGDLVYGLSVPRDRYVQSIRNLRSLTHAVIDDLNNQFLGVGSGQSYGAPTPGISTASAQTAGAFRAFLESTLEHRGKPLSGTGTGSDSHVNARLRRASKLGIAFATGRGGRVRFVLDEIDMGQVTRKDHRDDRPTSSGKNRAITGSELRYLYRHRGDAAMMANVEFYYQGSPVGAPWTDSAPWNQAGGGRLSDHQLWAAYAPRSGQGAQVRPPGLDLSSNSNGPGPGRPVDPRGPLQGPVLPSVVERDVAMAQFLLDSVAERAESGELEQDTPDALATNLLLFRDLDDALGRIGSQSSAAAALRRQARESIDAFQQRLAELARQ